MTINLAYVENRNEVINLNRVNRVCGSKDEGVFYCYVHFDNLMLTIKGEDGRKLFERIKNCSFIQIYDKED